MWLSPTKMAAPQRLVAKTSSLSKFMITAGLGLMLIVTAGSFSPDYIFFTSTFLIVSSFFFILFSSPNPEESIPEEEDEGCKEEPIMEYDREEEAIGSSVAEQVADEDIFQIIEGMQGQEGCGSTHRNLNDLETMSENESIRDNDHCMTTSEDDKDGCDNVARSSLSSEDDGSISDEDTLIELELPTGHYLSPKELEQHKFNLKQKLPDYYSCSRQRQSWMELLSETNNELMTEEENLIEIDISIGSIICPRFVIET
uniref:Uncharacterized protein n=1 Tax=Kalanchoe fedtschenkoi TaxID=63787 RepID=A0A7N0RDH3_KALFE